jgi:hypothetical protein
MMRNLLMADQRPDPDPTTDDPALGRAVALVPRTPRWVLVLGVLAVVLIIGFVVQAVLGGGHGPGIHAPSVQA